MKTQQQIAQDYLIRLGQIQRKLEHSHNQIRQEFEQLQRMFVIDNARIGVGVLVNERPNWMTDGVYPLNRFIPPTIGEVVPTRPLLPITLLPGV